MKKKLVIMISIAAPLFAAGCSPSSSRQSALARAARIDEGAPIVAQQSITIDAPIETVWKLVSQMDRWPEWQPNIKDVKVSGPVVTGQSFEWDNNGTKISSTVEIVRPFKVIAWTGSAMGLKAIHVWTLTVQTDGSVLVQTAESMRGFPSSLFYSSNDLKKSNAAWLQALKERSEDQVKGIRMNKAQ